MGSKVVAISQQLSRSTFGFVIHSQQAYIGVNQVNPQGSFRIADEFQRVDMICNNDKQIPELILNSPMPQ
jgi:hypothetical protein